MPSHFHTFELIFAAGKLRLHFHPAKGGAGTKEDNFYSQNNYFLKTGGFITGQFYNFIITYFINHKSRICDYLKHN